MTTALKNALILLLLGVVGCASTRQSLVTHPKPVVRYPSKVGDQMGTLLGFPISILLYPVTALASSGADRESRAWAPLTPVLFTRNVTSTAVGGIPWLFFGWWGVPTSESGLEAGNLPRTEAELHDAVSAYYSRWHGVKAPPFQAELRVSATRQPLSISQFRGSRLLLFAFDSGDFVRSVDTNAIIDRLRPLHDAIKSNNDDLSVVGFTYGVMFGFPGVDMPASITEVATFPVVNMTKLDLPEPYALLERLPSSILIDGNGIIIAVRLGHLDQDSLRELLELPSWSQTPRQQPDPPPSFILEYSQRKPFHYYVYAEAFPAGHRVQERDLVRTNVYSRLLLPKHRILRKSSVIGKLLHNSVHAGQVVLESDVGARYGH